MPTIELAPGEALVVTFAETDGEVTVAYALEEPMRCVIGCRPEVAKELPHGIVVHVDLPDTQGRGGIIYHEPFSDLESLDKEEVHE
jgi:hypothetical protein